MTNTNQTDRANLELTLGTIAAVNGDIVAAVAAITLSVDDLLAFADMIPGGFPMPVRYQDTARASIIAGLCERWVAMTGSDVV